MQIFSLALVRVKILNVTCLSLHNVKYLNATYLGARQMSADGSVMRRCLQRNVPNTIHSQQTPSHNSIAQQISRIHLTALITTQTTRSQHKMSRIVSRPLNSAIVIFLFRSTRLHFLRFVFIQAGSFDRKFVFELAVTHVGYKLLPRYNAIIKSIYKYEYPD